jgi:ribosomal protein L11 methyltransferase
LKSYPAIEVQSAATDLLLAMVDEFAPTAIEDRHGHVRIFFATRAARDLARDGLASHFGLISIEVPDEDWARHSQENLTPITVGRVTIAPNSKPQASRPDTIAIVIAPSMGFGTGHHATTRLCLAALQTLDLEGAFVLDVGTGSGVLAIAANRLGAARARGIDFDPDAIQSARENLTLNPEVRGVSFDVADLGSTALPHADVMTANLTGAVLARSAPMLLDALQPGGTIILGGLQVHEREDVGRAFAAGTVVWEREEDGWVGLAVKRR